jgi:hypothetical protein
MRKMIPVLLSLFLATPLLAADVRQLIDSTAFVIEEAFVDPARAKVIAAALRKKTFDEKLEGEALAEAITKAIWSVEDDGHLNVHYQPATASAPLATRDELRARLNEPGVGGPVRRMAPGIPAPERAPEMSSRMLEGNIGYISFLSFPRPEEAQEQTAAAMRAIEDAKAVVIDLRQNRGGTQQLVNYVASYFFPEDDRVLLTSRFRAEPAPMVSHVVPVPTRKLEKVPLTILISDRTFSAGEAFAYILQQFGRATVIGQKTRGGGRPNAFVDLGAGYRASVSIGAVEHPVTRTGWQGTGVVPDVAASADEALGVALERWRPAPADAAPSRGGALAILPKG